MPTSGTQNESVIMGIRWWQVESGETKEQALIKECREELNVLLSVGDVFLYVIHKYPDLTVLLTLLDASIAECVPLELEHNDIK